MIKSKFTNRHAETVSSCGGQVVRKVSGGFLTIKPKTLFPFAIKQIDQNESTHRAWGSNIVTL